MAWTLFSERVMKAARALAEMGVKTGDNVGVYSQNMEQYLLTDSRHSRTGRSGADVCYLFAEQVNYIVNDASIKILFVGAVPVYSVQVQQEREILRKLIVFDRQVVSNQRIPPRFTS